MDLLNPFTRLDPYSPVPEFDCGDADLNEFFAVDASGWQKDLLTVTYYLSLSGGVALYFSLSNDKITAETLPKNFWRKIKAKFPHQKHRSDYPAVKIGRFAIGLSLSIAVAKLRIFPLIHKLQCNNLFFLTFCVSGMFTWLGKDLFFQTRGAMPNYFSNHWDPFLRTMGNICAIGHECSA